MTSGRTLVVNVTEDEGWCVNRRSEGEEPQLGAAACDEGMWLMEVEEGEKRRRKRRRRRGWWVWKKRRTKNDEVNQVAQKKVPAWLGWVLRRAVTASITANALTKARPAAGAGRGSSR